MNQSNFHYPDFSTAKALADTNRNNNGFNWKLQQYRKATARLEQYELSVGVPEQSQEVFTGEYAYDEETGEQTEVTETVVTPAIEPLPATVEITVYSDDPDAEPTTETVPNPLIVQDEAERAQAQATIDNTPEDVRNFGVEEEE